MQNRGLIITFIVLLSLACIYQLSFTWVTHNVEKNAKEYANGNYSIEKRYLDSIANEEVYPVLGFTYKKCKEREINLGLDLKGGMSVILELSVEDIIKELSGNNKDKNFIKAIHKAKEWQKTKQKDFVTLFGEAFKEIDPNARLITIFYTRNNQSILSRDASNEEVLKFLKKETNDAIDRTFNILRTRVNQFGIAQPNIQKLESSDRILVELPGVKDKERVRKLLQGTAKLEFWETYDNPEIFPYLDKANKELKLLLYGNEKKDSISSDTLSKSNIASANKDSTKKKPVLLEELKQNDSISEDTSGIENLADNSKNNPLFQVLRPAIFPNEQGQYYPGQGPVVAFVAIKDTGKVNKYLKMPKIKALFPPNLKLLWTAKPYDKEGKYLELVAIKVNSRDGKAPLGGDVIVDARQDYDNFSNKPEVRMIMNKEGAKKWKLLTKENIGKSIAIVLDNYVYSFPTVQSEISGGSSSITGNFTIEEAKDLAIVLKAGKLPAPTKIVEEAIVGPSLGQEAIQAGFQSFLIALFIVLLYMFFYYSKAGIASGIALLANMFFIIGVLASTNIALTLPGIAGIVLTIGMSVDANVLIYERIKEEMRSGKTIRTSIDEGYKHAYSSIIDANVTTLLTGIILWFFGTGPIEGFAKTLVIGILTSLFSAIFITRIISSYQLDKNKKPSFFTKITKNTFQNINIQFVKRRKIFYLISSLLIIAGLISFFTRGLHYGVDFKGGRSYIVRFEKNVKTQDIRNALANVFIDKSGLKYAPEVKTFGSNNQVKITTSYLIEKEEPGIDEKIESKLNEGLSKLNNSFEILSSQKVGPTIADDIKKAAFWSVLFSLIIIFLYILLRFQKWQFGFGAIVALFHDVLIVLSVFSLFYGFLPFSLEIDQAFIAAILTVVGYSINDTVVVFDRVREFLRMKIKNFDDHTIINNALNQTLGRTINTSLTTFFVLLMIFLFGGEVIRGFAFALLIGIVVGTYSSVCIATPVYFDFAYKSSKINTVSKKKN